MKILKYLALSFVLVCCIACEKDDVESSEDTITAVAGDESSIELYIDDELVVCVESTVEDLTPDSDLEVLYPVVTRYMSGDTDLDLDDVSSTASATRSIRVINKEAVLALAESYAEHNDIEYDDLAIYDFVQYVRDNDLNLAALYCINQIAKNNDKTFMEVLVALKELGLSSDFTFADLVTMYEDELINKYNSIYQDPSDLNLTKSSVDTKAAGWIIVVGIIGGVTTVVKGVVSFIQYLISNAEPLVSLTNNYVSFLNEDDTNAANYPTSGKSNTSQTYTLQHKFWGVVYAKVSYCVHVDYNGINATLNDGIKYVPSVAMAISNIVCKTGQHVEGQVTYGTATVYDDYIQVPGEILIEYGDCCCYDHQHTLKFYASGKDGFVLR